LTGRFVRYAGQSSYTFFLTIKHLTLCSFYTELDFEIFSWVAFFRLV